MYLIYCPLRGNLTASLMELPNQIRESRLDKKEQALYREKSQARQDSTLLRPESPLDIVTPKQQTRERVTMKQVTPQRS